MQHPLHAAADAAALFERAGLPYVLVGGMAAILYGELRSTYDVDFAVHMDGVQVERLAALAEGTFLVDLDAARRAARDHSLFVMVHLPTYFKVDVHVRPRTGIHREEIERARWKRLGSGFPDEVRVATVEDVLLQKLRWYRAGGEVSTTQWRDVLGILKMRAHSLDRDYLRRWASELSVADLLQRARREAGAALEPDG